MRHHHGKLNLYRFSLSLSILIRRLELSAFKIQEVSGNHNPLEPSTSQTRASHSTVLDLRSVFNKFQTTGIRLHKLSHHSHRNADILHFLLYFSSYSLFFSSSPLDLMPHQLSNKHWKTKYNSDKLKSFEQNNLINNNPHLILISPGTKIWRWDFCTLFGCDEMKLSQIYNCFLIRVIVITFFTTLKPPFFGA